MFPHKIELLQSDLNEKLMKYFRGERLGFCQVGDEKWFLPIKYKDEAEAFYNMPLRKDDIWILTFPRSGTTMTQAMQWLVNNNADIETMKKIPLFKRYLFLENSLFYSDEYTEELITLNKHDPETCQNLRGRKPGTEVAKDLESPRFIKSHLPFSLLSPRLLDTCKVVYVARNPKDVAVSYYYHNRLFRGHDYKGDFETYWEFFENNQIVFGPYWPHINEAWAKKDHPNMLFLFYEDIIRDIPGAINKLAKFYNKILTDEQVNQIASVLHINNFRKEIPLFPNPLLKGLYNERETEFIRKGKIGDNKEELSPELEKKSNEWIKNNIKNSNVRFPIDL